MFLRLLNSSSLRFSGLHVNTSCQFHTTGSLLKEVAKGKALPRWKQKVTKKKLKAFSKFKPTSRTRLAEDLKPTKPEKATQWRRQDIPRTYKAGEEAVDSKDRLLKYEKQDNRPKQKSSVEARLDEEFDRSSKSTITPGLPQTFTSPPLLPGLAQSIHSILGDNARPTAIQALSLQHLFRSRDMQKIDWKQFLLASETGSGKSFAYLLPLLQYLKQTESSGSPTPETTSAKSLPLNPRALVLAPTHELTRQLSSFAKSLVHNVKLRVLCASRANVPNVRDSGAEYIGVGGASARQMKRSMDAFSSSNASGSEIEVLDGRHNSRSVDVLVATPVKALEMVRGWGWDKLEERDGKKFVPGRPEMGLERVEYVVVDEADVLYDTDFQETTLDLLSSISSARGQPVPLPSPLPFQPSPTPSTQQHPPLTYPYNLTLTSATIPASLSSFLTTFHPHLTRLVSPQVHHLPSTLRTEHVGWTGGNRFADVEKRIRNVWAEDALRAQYAAGGRDKEKGDNTKSKILVFCNRGTRVEELGNYLTEKGIANVALTSTSDARLRGSNRHLAGFLKASSSSLVVPTPSASADSPKSPPTKSMPETNGPRVLITTSLLSRGLDFAPSVRHVFIVDPPRNMVDFLHRAGRSGRAGESGKVVVFGKMKGRGADEGREVRRKLGALRTN